MNNTKRLIEVFDKAVEEALEFDKAIRAYYERIDKREAEHHDITKSDMGVKKWNGLA